ncbi:hypothetical protein [Curtobacterium aetherium]|uniref:Uncharacterized protein n=1 Tax=Curtobacterium aetherium TaxID=2841594 RepID=A0ACD1E7T1_9MICO|nr:hypothetical protein [Curtobacterium sp. L6-1]QWS34727.1 hypothetical protein KM842_06220 [Curtobacterium sp. L6-1]
MIIVVTVIAVVVAIAAVLVVVEVQNRRRRRALAHLEPTDPAIGARAVADAEHARSTAEGLSKSAHPGLTGGAGMTPGA